MTKTVVPKLPSGLFIAKAALKKWVKEVRVEDIDTWSLEECVAVIHTIDEIFGKE